MSRYLFTGAPGSGKTVLLAALQARGHAVVAEAATDVIAERQAAGDDEPWLAADFVDRIVQLQRQRQDVAPPDGVQVQLFDRSPLCTLALAYYLQRPVTPLVKQEVARVVREQVYEPVAFFVRPLGFVSPSAARRISYADSLRFEVVHEQVYRDHGFSLIDVPSAPVLDRADLVERALPALWPNSQPRPGS